MNKLRVLDLFSGIGGFSLGLERTGGFETVAFCEIEDFPRRVLAKHWPDVPCYRDVRELTAERLAADGIAVDVICGGFPCQDISTAGKGAGLAGERSGLFYEIARLVSELAPRFIILENVAALLGRGLGDILGTLAALGFDAEWHCIPASALGAPHRRDRIWIVAYPGCSLHARELVGRTTHEPARGSQGGDEGQGQASHRERLRIEPSAGGSALADAISAGQSGSWSLGHASNPAPLIQRQAIDAFHGRVGDFWSVEPDVGRVANGVPDRSHRLKALGNAVVPQIPELIGRAILEAIATQQEAA